MSPMHIMRPQLIILLIIVLLAILSSGQTCSAVSEGLLSVKGASIVNPIGRIVLLRGVNYPGYDQDEMPDRHSESVYKLFARFGFNVVRLPISWSHLEPSPGKFYEPYLERYVDNDIRWAKKYGLYIVLDMHQTRWGANFGGSGIPDWLVDQYPFTDAGMRRAVSDFWVQTNLQSHLVKVWRDVARRYANETTIAGYDLLNEPWIYTSIIPQLNASNVNDLYLRTIRSIRTVDPNHIIFLEPSNMPPPDFPVKENIVWSPHFYPLAFDPSYNQRYSDLLEADIEAKYQKFVVEMGSPMWIGEFGAFMDGGSAQVWLRDALKVFDKYQLGWAWWAFDDRSRAVPSPLYARNQGAPAESGTETGTEISVESVLLFAGGLEVMVIGILVVLLARTRTSKKHGVTKRQRRRTTMSSTRSGTDKA